MTNYIQTPDEGVADMKDYRSVFYRANRYSMWWYMLGWFNRKYPINKN